MRRLKRAAPGRDGTNARSGPGRVRDVRALYRGVDPSILRMMVEGSRQAGTEPYDVIVVGAGMCGVIFLKYALEGGLRCLVLEKQEQVGGLWAWLPAWQDIQNRREDFAIDGVPLEGVTQPYVQRHVQAWVDRFDLTPHIALGTEVTCVARADGGWTVDTASGTFRARHIVAATGVQNEPWIPEVERTEASDASGASVASVREVHSARLHHPEELAGRDVTVVGGGASAYDMIELAVRHGASSIHWVHRHPKWFLPTHRSKQRAWPNLRELGLIQTFLPSPKGVNTFMRWMLHVQYRFFRLREIQPSEAFDVRVHQLIPGRASMLRRFDAIERHRGEIRRIGAREVELESGQRVASDIVLWGTGFRMNLGYLGMPELRGIDRVDELMPRLGSLVRSIDEPDLFFIGMSLTESTSSTPLLAAIEAKSIVAHIKGLCEIPTERTPRRVAYWDLFGHFARFDRANYAPGRWRLKYALLALWYEIRRNGSVTV